MEIIDVLRSHEALVLFWRVVIYLSAAFLILLGAAIFIKPSAAMDFFSGFAATTAANTLESVLRFIVGLGFMGAAPETKYPLAATIFGAFCQRRQL